MRPLKTASSDGKRAALVSPDTNDADDADDDDDDDDDDDASLVVLLVLLLSPTSFAVICAVKEGLGW